jgi:hypothetical protein
VSSRQISEPSLGLGAALGIGLSQGAARLSEICSQLLGRRPAGLGPVVELAARVLLLSGHLAPDGADAHYPRFVGAEDLLSQGVHLIP